MGLVRLLAAPKGAKKRKVSKVSPAGGDCVLPHPAAVGQNLSQCTNREHAEPQEQGGRREEAGRDDLLPATAPGPNPIYWQCVNVQPYTPLLNPAFRLQ